MSAEACESCDGEGRVRVWSLADPVGFILACQDCEGTGVWPGVDGSAGWA